MIKLNRTTEYGLIALRHMARKTAEGSCAFTSAREISDVYTIPFEILAKTLQRLKSTGLIKSAQGARGGYVISRSLAQINLAEFLEVMEGCQLCGVQPFMGRLNGRVQDFLAGITLSELVEELPATPARESAHQEGAVSGGEP